MSVSTSYKWWKDTTDSYGYCRPPSTQNQLTNTLSSYTVAEVLKTKRVDPRMMWRDLESSKKLEETMNTQHLEYRIIVGERGNDYGHVIPTAAKTLLGAKRVLTRELKKYRGDGWGRIEYRQPGEGWRRDNEYSRGC